MFQEKSDICVDDGRFHLVKDKNVGQGPEESKAETGLNARFRPTGDQEFDLRNPFHQPAHHGEDGRLRVAVRALVQCVDGDDRRDT